MKEVESEIKMLKQQQTFYYRTEQNKYRKWETKMNKPTFSDITLTCCDCNGTFPFSAGGNKHSSHRKR
jgi:hypothetical protein